MNYFEFYELPVSFLLEASVVKKRFLQLSKQYHPDFYTLESAEKQAEILEKSTMNTNAFKTLSNFDARMKYVLGLKGVLDEEGQAKLPQDFLMEMMDVNEELMELEFDNDPTKVEVIKNTVQGLENELYAQVSKILEDYDEKNSSSEELETVKDYYYKKRYLLRIRENLNKFAAR
ncbi:MAG: Fe-S protein assembly co-chaperone HscB [Bacteroidota bacterium]